MTTEEKEIRVKLNGEACERLKEDYRLLVGSGIIKFKTEREKSIFFRDYGIDDFKDVEGTDYGNGEFVYKYKQSLMND